MPEPQPVREVDPSAFTAQRFRDEIVASGQPAVFRGLVRDWPIIAAARRSDAELISYLKRFDRGRAVGAMQGPARIKGRFFYNDDLSGFNFRKQDVQLGSALDFLLGEAEAPNPSAFAIQSVPVWQNLTGFERENPQPLLPESVEPRIWIGNKVTIAAHHDPSENIACVAAGTRRFTLFPPDQVGNLYPGPFELTPAGPTISMVDFDAPDAARFPGFADAMAAAQMVEMAPGDALYIPYLWWHHVRSLERFNILVNYWWTPPAEERGDPLPALMHALLAVRDLPPTHRAAWKAMFDHYVFRDPEPVAGHLPEQRRGVLARLSGVSARKLRASLLQLFGTG